MKKRGPTRSADARVADLQRKLKKAETDRRVVRRGESKIEAAAFEQIGRVLVNFASQDLRAKLGISAVLDAIQYIKSNPTHEKMQAMLSDAYDSAFEYYYSSVLLTEGDSAALQEAAIDVAETAQWFMENQLWFGNDTRDNDEEMMASLNEPVMPLKQSIDQIAKRLAERSDKS